MNRHVWGMVRSRARSARSRCQVRLSGVRVGVSRGLGCRRRTERSPNPAHQAAAVRKQMRTAADFESPRVPWNWTRTRSRARIMPAPR